MYARMKKKGMHFQLNLLIIDFIQLVKEPRIHQRNAYCT